MQAVVAADPDEVLGCNTRADLAAVDAVFRRRKRAAVMDGGGDDRIAGNGADRSRSHRRRGYAHRAMRATARQNAHRRELHDPHRQRAFDAVLEDNVLVKPYTMMSASHLSRGAQVGPFAHLREGARLEENARAGNFVEVKKSVLGEGGKSMHLTYLGDARVGGGTQHRRRHHHLQL